MSAGVSGVGPGATVHLLPRPKPAQQPAAGGIPAPEDQAFKVSTINQRLASIAAARADEEPRRVDITA
jgi:hypothetical protein